MLKTYLARLPMDILKKTRVTSTHVTVPTKIDPVEFHDLMRSNINKLELTPEKAIFIVAREVKQGYKTSINLLNSKLKL